MIKHNFKDHYYMELSFYILFFLSSSSVSKSLTHSLNRSLIHSITHLFSFTSSLTPSLTHSLHHTHIHSITHLLLFYLVNCTAMYKDSVNSGGQFTDYQLRSELTQLPQYFINAALNCHIPFYFDTAKI